MGDEAVLLEEQIRKTAFIRGEMRFEISSLHETINALIGAEAFLTISFTMALGSYQVSGDSSFFVVSAIFSMLGCSLAVFAWPGVSASVKIINEWNVMLVDVLGRSPDITRAMWRPSLADGEIGRSDLAHRRSMLFARSVPIVFAVAWATLAGSALVGVWM